MMSIKKNNKEYIQFDKFSHEWWNEDGEFAILHKIRPIRIEYIISNIKPKKIKDLHILDVGCGGGLVSEPLAKLGGEVTGLDFVENNIEVAKQHSKQNNINITYKCLDIEKQNLTKKYDLIVMFEILEHLENWQSFIQKIKNNLKKNGVIIMSTINRNFLSYLTSIVLAENFLRWVPKGTHDYNKLIKPDELKEVLIKNNFEIKNLTGLKFNPFLNEWNLSQDSSINYFCTAQVSN